MPRPEVKLTVNTAGLGHRRSSEAYLSLRPKRDKETGEIEYLLDAFKQALCWEWAIVLSTLLLDVDSLVALFRLKDCKLLFKPWKEALDATARYKATYTLKFSF